MATKVLLTSTSFQDTPGEHQTMLNNHGFEILKLRGPLKEHVLLDVIGDFDGIICGDDEITRNVIEKGVAGRLKIISKYGIGLDKIDVDAASYFNIPVTNCPGVNQVTVAEHVFALLLSFVKNIIPEDRYIRDQKWTRMIGSELFGKTIAIVGLGNVGKEVVLRAAAFGLKIIAFDKYPDTKFAKKYNVKYCDSIEELLKASDIISLNASLNSETRNLINSVSISWLKPGVIIVNTARSGLVEENAILKALDQKIIGGYLTDVLDEEPMIKDHPYLSYDNVIITPHIGSRTYENVVNQGKMAVNNLLKYINS
jgi:D-3-phosphoglycerate dehydrogenase